jgi:hypothetical protein
MNLNRVMANNNEREGTLRADGARGAFVDCVNVFLKHYDCRAIGAWLTWNFASVAISQSIPTGIRKRSTRVLEYLEPGTVIKVIMISPAMRTFRLRGSMDFDIDNRKLGIVFLGSA